MYTTTILLTFLKKFQYFLDFGQSITINSQTTSNIKNWCIYKMCENENVPNEEKKVIN